MSREERWYSMERFYKVLGGSRQNFHRRRMTCAKRQELENQLVKQVRIWRLDHPKMGSRTIYNSMKASGFELGMGVSAFEKLLSRKGLTVQPTKRTFPQTSDGKGKGSYENLTNGLILDNINQLVSTDITYIWIADRWHYLFTLKDVYSQKLVSLVPSTNMKGENAIRLLRELEQQRQASQLKGCIHHSDNGSQYDGKELLGYLKRLEMRVSRAGSCEQNGSCEQMHHIVKNMYLRNFGIRNFEELEVACRKTKRLMNEQRAVRQLGYRTVEAFEQYIEKLDADQRPQKTLYDFSEKS